MGVRIRKFSKCIKASKNPLPAQPPIPRPVYKHKFPAETRIEKIMDREIEYPESTPRKIVFKSNDYGTGFMDERTFEVPAEIQAMKDQVNLASYKTWSRYRDHSERDHFKERDHYTNRIVKVGCAVLTLFVIPVLLGQQIEELIQLLMYASCIIAFIGVSNSSYVFAQSYPEFQIDEQTQRAIKSALDKLNTTQKEQHPSPRYRWSCSKECLWIACERLDYGQNDKVEANGDIVIDQASSRFQTSRVRENELIDKMGRKSPGRSVKGKGSSKQYNCYDDIQEIEIGNMRGSVSGKEGRKSVMVDKSAKVLEVRRWGDWGTIYDIIDERLD